MTFLNLWHSKPFHLVAAFIIITIGFFAAIDIAAQAVPLSDRAKGLDANKNGLVDRDEARGPLAANFDDMDCDKNGGLDGAEIPAFFQGKGCPKKEVSEKSKIGKENKNKNKNEK